MTTNIFQSATVPYSCQQMFTLVNDVASYPDFIPFCQSSAQRPLQDNTVEASLTFSFFMISQSLTTHNVLEAPHKITMTLADGPLTTLDGYWLFEPEDKGCKISFSLQFTSDNPLFNRTFSPLFQQAMAKMVNTFTQRAQTIYGPID